MSGFITFHMNGRDLACQLEEVREVVRAVGIDAMPGTRAPVSGMLELRNDPLPVIDLRSNAYPGEEGDVLVLNPGPDGSYGVAVDRVLAVVSEDELIDDVARLLDLLEPGLRTIAGQPSRGFHSAQTA